jgi:hypothetical protein
MEILHETVFEMLCEMSADWLHYLDGLMVLHIAKPSSEGRQTHEVKSHWDLELRDERCTGNDRRNRDDERS